MKHLTALRKELESTFATESIEIDHERAALLISDIVESERILAMLNSPKCVTLEAGAEYQIGIATVVFERGTPGKVDITATFEFPPLWRRILGVFDPKYLFQNT